MTHFENNNEEELEKLRMENELKKAKLILEHGAIFSESGESKINPEIENEFLKNIEAFERSFHNSEQIALYDFIHRPEYKLVDEIPDAQIGAELAKIMNMLHENEINLDTLCEVQDRELYRFITEELFPHEIDNMRIPGMRTCFIYEEFHPNHEYDIRNNSTYGIREFLNKKDDFDLMYFTQEARDNEWLKHFRDAFKSFSIKKLEITEVSFDEQNALANFFVDFSATIEGSNEKQRYKGNGSAELKNVYDFWCIDAIRFPEMVKL
jgi:hypothetical protein